eukprot:CAMPEP_0197263760 /NCGR_PEP_ID=MMETSP1432-20130617/1370_1 /TAXON_ID=44447 /ORGANISM="Pseudo-nitzschia delicatissima, Strain UNC1205" /LENGTH=261 /DNA_ID=CAMNT_0042728309 /DNA_START=359 /DNA_END=1141 /DNA_ORIENTATION=+
MTSLSQRCFLLLCLSTLFVHTAEAWMESAGWTESHDAKWAENVAENKKLLTAKGRKSLHDEMMVRNGQLEQNRNLQVSSSGPELNVMVVLMQWSNHPTRNTVIPRESYDKVFNGEGRDADLYPGGSVKDYFKAMSYGDFSIKFTVTDWIMTDYTEQQFTADGSQGRTQELQEAFKPVLEYLDDDFFNFRNFDSNFDRRIDLTVFLHSGYDGTNGGDDCETGATQIQRVASHARWNADESDWVSKAGYRLGAYAVRFLLCDW